MRQWNADLYFYINQDIQFTDDNCVYLKFPVHGGTYNTVSKKIGKHLHTPFISSDRVCIRSCGQGI